MNLSPETLDAIARFLQGLAELADNTGVTIESGAVVYAPNDDIAGYLDVEATDETGTVYALRPSGTA